MPRKFLSGDHTTIETARTPAEISKKVPKLRPSPKHKPPMSWAGKKTAGGRCWELDPLACPLLPVAIFWLGKELGPMPSVSVRRLENKLQNRMV